LLKIANDLRLLSSGPDAGLGEIRLPERQAGSSIMPGKVNPVIPEAVAQAAIAVMGYDLTIVQAVSGGNLELSQFLPLVADSLLTALDLMASACDIFARLCVAGIVADGPHCLEHVHNSTAVITALTEHVGHHEADRLATAARDGRRNIRQMVLDRGLMTAEEFDRLISAERSMQLGSPTESPQQRSKHSRGP
jgi:aspartate ammonia-lyase